jgi:protein-tyrosine phosphatase
MKVLMVCLGNICRSPIAEGILREKIAAANLPWTVDSAGTGAWHAGEQPDARSIEVARQNGLDISTQRARRFRHVDLEQFDVILVMDRDNYRNVMSLSSTEQHAQKVRLILSYADDPTHEEVPDPYIHGGFPVVYEMLDKACEQFVKKHTARQH